jgi:phosphate transport system substrate-binding protein
LQNRAGRWPEPGSKSFAAALRDSGWTRSGEFEEMLTNSTEIDAWPITAGTFVVMRRVQDDASRAAQVLSFFTWAFMHGDRLAEKLRWIPLPINTQARVVKEMSKLNDRTGAPISFSYVQ